MGMRKKDREIYNYDENNRGAFAELNREKPRRGTVFDAFLALALVLVLLMGYLYVDAKRDVTGGERVVVSYDLQVDDVLVEYKDSAKVGDIVRDGSTNAILGTISYVEVFPYSIQTEDKTTGTHKQTKVPDRYSVRMTVRAIGQIQNGFVTIDGQDMAIGRSISIESANFSGQAQCVAMTTEQ